MKRIFAVLCVLTLAIGCLCGCNVSGGGEEATGASETVFE